MVSTAGSGNSTASGGGSQVVNRRRPIPLNGCGSPDPDVRQVRSANHRGLLLRRARVLIFFALLPGQCLSPADCNVLQGQRTGPLRHIFTLSPFLLSAIIRVRQHRPRNKRAEWREPPVPQTMSFGIDLTGFPHDARACGLLKPPSTWGEVLSRRVYELESGMTRIGWPQAAR